MPNGVAVINQSLRFYIVLETEVLERVEKASQGCGHVYFRVCGPHNVEGKEGERERKRERDRFLGDFTFQANIDLGQDLASLM
jgi:hypothetical protein